jgi:hypothetical protein
MPFCDCRRGCDQAAVVAGFSALTPAAPGRVTWEAAESSLEETPAPTCRVFQVRKCRKSDS